MPPWNLTCRTLRPTYRLTIGLPGRSNALAIAQRLGLPETIIAAARSEINPQDLRADQLIGDIHRQRNQAHKEREKAERARSEARRLERELAEKMEKIEEERQAVLEKARDEGELEIAVLKTQLKTLKQELKKPASRWRPSRKSKRRLRLSRSRSKSQSPAGRGGMCVVPPHASPSAPWRQGRRSSCPAWDRRA